MKQRIDLFLVQQGYFQSREQAQAAIMAGEVSIGGKKVEKPGQMISVAPEEHVANHDSTAPKHPADVQIQRTEQQYVSRGGKKLAKALTAFQVQVAGKVCLDAGASTGGFTDCLLQNGAGHVYAVDVGYGQLAWKIRQDSRVTVFERENIRFFDPDRLPVRPSFMTADLSFISLQLVLPKFRELPEPNCAADLITLIKPQFEAGKDKVGKKGVVRDKDTHREVLARLSENGPATGWFLVDLTFSPLLGPEGNIEYLGHWRNNCGPEVAPTVDAIVEAAWRELKV